MAYTGVTTIKGKKYIWLQGIGYAKAKKIENFKPGDNMAFNYGYSAKVITKPKKTSPKFYTIKLKNDNGKTYNQKVKMGSYKPYFEDEK